MSETPAVEDPLEVHQNALNIVDKSGRGIRTSEMRIQLESGGELVAYPAEGQIHVERRVEA